ncbi:hypothetical protein [Sporosarcina sp. OR05]|uniref:hypothetical protein n=1 Tax=Sporosarcina sp. OR05 TaxID=2969819 RepID=UPI00352AC23B
METKYNSSQSIQIDLGKKNGLTETQLDIYRETAYSGEQMEAIRVSLQEGVNSIQLKQYCNPAIDYKTLRIIGWALKNKFTQDEIQQVLAAEEPFAVYEDILVEKEGH